MNKKSEKNQRIQVFARCRPLNDIEIKQYSPSIVEVIPAENKILVKDRHTNREYKFDRFDKVFSSKAEQISVYKAVAEPLIKEVLMGYNCTVFAYGQTGTGKTYTMEGERFDSNCSWENDPKAGIIPRSIHQLFEELEREPKTEFSVRVSFLELYNEELFDLLSSAEFSKLNKLSIQTSKKGEDCIKGLQEIVVNRKDEVYSILEKGASRRQTAATLLNASSSRSHTVFSVTVKIKETTDDGEDLLKTGKLNLVDLAGSENVGRSGAVDKRAREAGNINQSLLTLGRVITALIDKQPHVPYRESKLTRLLQDSLGGRTKTSIIATISPALCNFDETISTLDYATKAQKITIKPEINQKMSKKTLIKELTDEIERLQKDLAALRCSEGFYIDSENYTHLIHEVHEKSEIIKDLSVKIEILLEEKAKIEEFFESTKEKLDVVTEQHHKVSKKYEKTAAELSSTTNVLSKTKQVLTETALERDERQFLINIQANTEKKLSQQAQKLLHVTAETTSDVEKLHAKIDRKTIVEKTNEEKCKEFRVNLPKQLASLADFVSHTETQQSDILSDVKKDLDELVQSVLSIKEQKNNFSNQLLSIVESHFGNLVENFTSNAESQTRWTNAFLEESKSQKETILGKLKSFLYEILPKVTQEMDLRNSEMEKWFFEKQAQLSQKIEEQKLTLIKNSEFRKTLQHSIKESLDALCKDYEQFTVDFELQLATRTEKERIMKQDFNRMMEHWNDLENISQRHSLLVPELKNKSWKTQEVINPLSSLCKAEEGLEDNLSALNEFSSLVNVNHKEEFSLMQSTVKHSQQKAIGEFEKFTTDYQKDQETEMTVHETALNNLMASISENLESNKKHVTVINSSIKDCVNTSATSFNAQLEGTKKNIHHTEDKIRESKTLLSSTSSNVKNSLLLIDNECEKFISEELQKDIPTGKTPQRKTYSYPRLLAATSPHERILQRYRSQLAADTAVAINLPLDASFEEIDELKESSDSTDDPNIDRNNAHSTSFSSDESATCDTDSCHSSMLDVYAGLPIVKISELCMSNISVAESDLSIESSKNKENQKRSKKNSRLPQKIKSKTFAKPAIPSIRKPLVTSNSVIAEQSDS